MQNKFTLPNYFQNPIIKNILLFSFLFLVTLIADYSILSNDVMYPEQPTMYLLNQTIHSFGDLLNVYLHPKYLDEAIPFFRPSGHFLLYQLLTPLVGWHSTRALIVVNLMFLAMTGVVMIKLFQIFFPSYRMGGYLAFGFYLMHPSLILSRFLLLHFEFAYVFFLLLGLYYFILFCQKNINLSQQIKSPVMFQHFAFLGYALIMFCIAITFKEGALMLGPAMLMYFLIFYPQQCFSKQGWKINSLIMVVTCVLGLYLTLGWENTPKNSAGWMGRIAVLNEFLKNLSGSRIDLLTHGNLPSQEGGYWRDLVFTQLSRILIACFLLAGLLNAAWILLTKNDIQLRKSILFLFSATLIFLIMPFAWAMGFPWHWNVSILFLSFILGFGVEVFLRKLIRNHFLFQGICTGLFFTLMFSAIKVNSVNIANVLKLNPYMDLIRQAVFHPVKPRDQLTENSIILVAVDSDPYMYGNSRAGFSLEKDYGKMAKNHLLYYRQLDTYYNGTLFKWAYLMPTLREEYFPFSIDNMKDLPNGEIYRWLENYKNIVCLTADKEWHDVTEKFRMNLLREKARRHLLHYSYDIDYAENMTGSIISRENLPYPDSKICQFKCDQMVNCKGFLYINNASSEHPYQSCAFFSSIDQYTHRDFCPVCQGYMKQMDSLS